MMSAESIYFVIDFRLLIKKNDMIRPSTGGYINKYKYTSTTWADNRADPMGPRYFSTGTGARAVWENDFLKRNKTGKI